MKKFIFICITLLLAGCQSTRQLGPTVPLGSQLSWQLPPFDWVQAPSTRTQQVVAWHGDKRWQLLGEMQLAKDKLSLTAVSGFGSFLFQASFDGQGFTLTKSPLLPAEATPEQLLADLLLALLPVERLRQSLVGSGATVTEQQGLRVVHFHKDMVRIQYLPKGFRFEQLALGYGFEVTYD